jgi:hypothetical protein
VLYSRNLVCSGNAVLTSGCMDGRLGDGSDNLMGARGASNRGLPGEGAVLSGCILGFLSSAYSVSTSTFLFCLLG